jgi:hypothetical protein
MKRTFRTAALWLLLPACALAQDSLVFSVGADWSYKQLTLEEKSGAFLHQYKPKLWMLGISPSMAYRGFFVSLVAERSLGNSTTGDYDSTGTVYEVRTWEREENGVSLGYNVWSGFSVFAGYLKNQTAATLQTAAIRYKYTEEGPYYGIGYAHRFGSGTLAASIAQTDAKGRVRGEPAGLIDQPGDVTGQSFGLMWSAPLAGSVIYRVGYKGTRYEFEFFDPVLNQQRTTKQLYDAFFFGVANYF